MYFDNEIKFVYFKLLLHIQDNLNKNKPHKTTSCVILDVPLCSVNLHK